MSAFDSEAGSIAVSPMRATRTSMNVPVAVGWPVPVVSTTRWIPPNSNAPV
jgi:hypothetical protein